MSVAWAAGLFEGEGCIVQIQRKKDTPKHRAGTWSRNLQLTMTDEDVVRRFHDIVGCGTVLPRAQPAPHKAQWIWRANRWANIRYVLQLFEPYLGDRRRAAAEALLDNPPKHYRSEIA